MVFARGGDHGANWDGGLAVDPTSDTQPFKMQVASIPWAGGTVKYLSEGDEPVISTDSKQIAFIRNGQVWTAPVDGSTAAGNPFTTRGTVSGLQWSPDGKRLLFVTARTDHARDGP